MEIPKKEELDKLNIVELVEKYSSINLVTIEGYGGENKNDYLPDYISKRIRQESNELEHSCHPINTWDTYSLRVPTVAKSKLAIMLIDKACTRGSQFRVCMANYERILEVTHVVSTK